MGPVQTVNEFLSMIWRRRLLIAAVTVACTVAVVLAVLARPRVFQAAAVIQVESPTITDGSGAVLPGSSAQRIQTIQQRLTTRDAMLAMIDRHGLYTDLPVTPDEKVHMLRLSVDFQPVASAAQGSFGAPQQVSALIITARADTADKAARIANDFAQGVLDASTENQSARARDALAFFDEEEASLAADIDRLEAEIAAYRNANADSLPATRESRRDEADTLGAEIRQLEQALAELASERSRIGQGRTLRESDQQQVAAIAAQEEVLRRQRDELAARRAALADALSRTPEVERTLATLDRRMEQLRAEYEGVTRRKADAETAQKLEERQQAERFTLLERAVSPDYPITGGRRKLVLAGAVASLMAGIAVAFLADLLRPALRTVSQFERDLGIRPVVAVPELGNLRRPRRPPMTAVRPGTAAASAGADLWHRLAALTPVQVLAALPRAALGALAAVVLLVLAMAVA
jgi:uncharacterized protein involved in exopolysaccharide biosynthesis